MRKNRTANKGLNDPAGWVAGAPRHQANVANLRATRVVRTSHLVQAMRFRFMLIALAVAALYLFATRNPFA